MAVDRINQKIMADAEAEVKKIDAEAERAVGELRDRTAGEVAGIEKRARDEAAAAALEQKERMISRAQAEMRKGLLAEKQKMIDRVFDKALKSVTGLPDGQYAALMKKLLLDGVETGDEEVIVADADGRRNWSDILAGVNRELSAAGKKGRLALSEERRSMAGGFILRKGKHEGNCDVAQVLRGLREELESDIVRSLFPTSQTGFTSQGS
jgi:V/A-type H+-transporting ATPase subunit E